jgi:phosphate transport system permease protein
MVVASPSTVSARAAVPVRGGVGQGSGATVVVARVARGDQGGPEQRRAISGRRSSDLLSLVGGALGSGALTWLLFTHLAPLSGVLGWVVVWYLIFLGLYAALVSLDESGQAVRDRIAAVAIQSVAAILLIALVFVIAYVVVRGVPAMVHLNLYLEDLSVTGPLQPLTSGGVLHGIVGTLMEISLALLGTVPLGITCAVFLNEFPGPYARIVRTVVEAMTALPSVVAGLFIFSLYVLTFGLPRSGLAAALALGVMMLPITIRAADVVLRLVPGSLTEASLALGASRWRTVWHVTLPTARSGLATAVILGTARGIGETSPVLLTAGYGNGLNLDPTEGPMVSLPLLAYELRRFPEDAMIARSFGAASLLLILVLILFVIARWIGGRGAGLLTPRQQRRRERRSQRDVVRLVTIARARLSAEAARAPEPVLEPVLEPVPEPVPEPVLEPAPEPVPEPVPEPAAGPESDTTVADGR